MPKLTISLAIFLSYRHFSDYYPRGKVLYYQEKNPQGNLHDGVS